MYVRSPAPQQNLAQGHQQAGTRPPPPLARGHLIHRYKCESYDVSPITIIQAQGEYLFKYLIIIITIIGQPTFFLLL